MASLYRRGDSPFFWAKWRGADGRKKMASTGKTDRKEAEEVLRAVVAKVAAIKKTAKTTMPTLRERQRTWTDRRLNTLGIVDARNEDARFKHLPNSLLDKPLDQVTRDDMLNAVKVLEADPELAPRTVHRIYDNVRVLFADAIDEGLVRVNPCSLKVRKKELPKSKDKDSKWRATAFLYAPELTRLLSDRRIPLYRKVIYGLEFCGAMRVSEAAARVWGDLEPMLDEEGKAMLDRLRIDTMWDRKAKVIRHTKTDQERLMPVHPALKNLLARWQEFGWAHIFGRAPTPTDWIVPSLVGARTNLNSNTSLEYLHADLAMLGLRKIRQHDGRRTLITLARAAGANVDILEMGTHGPKGRRAVDMYTSAVHASVSEQVLLVPVSSDPTFDPPTPEGTPDPATQDPELRGDTEKKKASVSAGLLVPRAGFEPAPNGRRGSPPEGKRRFVARGSRGGGPRQRRGEPPQRSHRATPSEDASGIEWFLATEPGAIEVAGAMRGSDTSHRGIPRSRVREAKARVAAIRADLAAGQKQSAIAKKFGLSRNAVSRIATGKRWKGVRS